MAFDKHTAKLAKYYRSVGQSPAGARRLAKEMSASYVRPPRKRQDPSGSTYLTTHNTLGATENYRSHPKPRPKSGKNLGSFKTRSGQWKKGKGGRFVGSGG